MKILTVAIPCYNSAEYMRKAIDHALVGGEDVEVLVIDDGSSDATLEIAREYERRYPGVVRAIHQENKGHGGAVNTGIREAAGAYFKVCDSDDYLDYDSYMQVLDVLRHVLQGTRTLDAMLCNYVYDKVGARHKRIMCYTGSFPENRIFTWDEMIKPLNWHRYVLMHSIIYRTQLLRDSGFELPEHTFYVDNIFAFTPFIYVKTLYYLNVPLYWYFIGRDDQSVNEPVMLSRIDQQLLVNRLMIDQYRPDLVRNRKQAGFLVHYMSVVMDVSSIMLLRIGTPEALEEKKQLWLYLKKKDRVIYLSVRNSLAGRMLNIRSQAGRKVTIGGYKLLQKFYGFN